MKKFLLSLIALIFVLPFTCVFALSKETFYIGGKVDNIHINMYKDGQQYNGYLYQYKRSDGKLVYCIEPFETINVSAEYDVYDYNNTYFKLSDEILNRINIIAYYGYGYKNHNDLKWYAATQFLIWKSLNLDNIYFDDPTTKKQIYTYDSYINEIETFVNDYYKLPSFANENIEYSSNRTYKLEDNNNVLDNYEILYSNISVMKNTNELIIDTENDGIYEIQFIKKSPIVDNYLLYYLNGSQSLISPGKIDNINFKLTIEVNSGSITINKVDSENINRTDATLQGATYGLYDNNYNLLEKIITDNTGYAYINNLPLGDYIVKEIIPSVGYELDDNIYEISITKDNKDFNITSIENIIKGSLVINKYYGTENNYKLENGATFNISNNNDISYNLTTQNGTINIELPYGNYEVKQLNGIQGYMYVNNFNVFINENSTYIYNLKDEIIEVEVPDTGIYYNKNNTYILFILLGFIILIYGIVQKKRV